MKTPRNVSKKRLLQLLASFLALTPLGLLTSNPDWGEWGLDYFKEKLGFVPKGIKSSSELVNAPFKDYRVFNSNLLSQVFSALIAIALIWAFFKLFLMFRRKKIFSNKNFTKNENSIN